MNTVLKIIILSVAVLIAFAMYVHGNIISQKIREMEEKKDDNIDSWDTIEVKVPKRVSDKIFNEPEE